MSEHKELNEKELESIVGGAQAQQAPSGGELQFEEYEEGSQIHGPRVSDVMGLD